MGILDGLVQVRAPRHGANKGVIELEGGMNVRELGGYATRGGRVLSHRFVRSGSTTYLTKADAKKLWSYGVRGVLDLRGADEVARSPERLCELLNVAYLNVALHDYDVTDEVLGSGDHAGGYLTETYFQMLANHEAVRQIFSFFCVQPERSCTLFHCGAGSDRTGVVSMLLLGLAGVDRAGIVADYAYSFGYMPEVNAAVFKRRGATPQDVRPELRLRIAAMGAVYDRMAERYGSIYAYLREAGVTEDELRRVRTRLLG